MERSDDIKMIPKESRPVLRSMIMIFVLVACIPGLASAIGETEKVERSSDPIPYSNCNRTSVGFTPMTDMGSASYKGYPGGLYGNGSNSRPQAHEDAGLAIAKGIVPLDANGTPDPNGKHVMLSIGMSNTVMEFTVFVPIGNAEKGKDPHLVIVNGAQGGWTAARIKDPNATFWTTIDGYLKQAGVTSKQVVAAWVKEADANPTLPFPDDATTVQKELVTALQIMKTRYPNLALSYFSSRIYAGYASTTLNPEPYAYQGGFTVKWLIEQQMSGDPALNFDPKKGTVRAPWIAWGPYLWADGEIPRKDGLIWKCADFNNDGTHPNTTARQKVSQMLIDFIRNDSTTREWFYSTPPPPPPPPNVAPKVEANPISTWPARKPFDVRATITDEDTEKVEVTYSNGSGPSTFGLVREPGQGSQSNWSGQIPARRWPGSASYSIVATDKIGQQGRWPASGNQSTSIFDEKPPAMAHAQKTMEAAPGTKIDVEVTASDDLGIDSITLLGWAPGATIPTNWTMTLANGTNESGVWRASITLPSKEGLFNYSFVARDSAHEVTIPIGSQSAYMVTLKNPANPSGSNAGIGSNELILIGVVIALIAAVGVAVLVILRKRKKER